MRVLSYLDLLFVNCQHFLPEIVLSLHESHFEGLTSGEKLN